MSAPLRDDAESETNALAGHAVSERQGFRALVAPITAIASVVQHVGGRRGRQVHEHSALDVLGVREADAPAPARAKLRDSRLAWAIDSGAGAIDSDNPPERETWMRRNSVDRTPIFRGDSGARGWTGRFSCLGCA